MKSLTGASNGEEKTYVKTAYDQSAGKQYSNIPKAVTACANYFKLTHEGKSLLLDAASLFNGKNNGDISLTYKMMHPKGWSKRKLEHARHELEHYRFINISRQGGRNIATLYSLAWINIHPCGDKLQVPSTSDPARTYLIEREKWRKPKSKSTWSPADLCLVSTGEVANHASR